RPAHGRAHHSINARECAAGSTAGESRQYVWCDALGRSVMWYVVPTVLSRQLIKQRLGVLQVSGVKALGEPAVDRCQQLIGFDALTLQLPQARQAQGSAQLPGPGLLL